ncbi:MAG: prolyl oligopeptidase family serine peptidase [bacterium]|nr:prolyl oligopeptidase family serine peptidase [bacterium]
MNALLLPILLVCVSAGPYGDAPPEVKPRDGFTLQTERITDRDIPTCMLFADKHADAHKPVVILIHGGAIIDVASTSGRPQTKEVWFEWWLHDVPYILAEKGFLVLSIDAWWAGERYKPEFNQMVQDNMFDALIRGYAETADDVSAIIDYLETRDDADATRVGVAGRSGGAIVSLMAAGREPRLGAAVSWAGGADFLETSRRKGLSDEALTAFMDKAPDLRQRIKDYDPIHTLPHIAPKAVLLVHNRRDPAMPYEGMETFHDKLKPFYTDHPERLRLLLLDTAEATHDHTAKDYQAGCDWFVRFLGAE